LQKRVRRLNSLGFQMFHFGLVQFFGFLKGQPLLTGILDDLERRRPTAQEEALAICDRREPRVSEDEVESAAIAYAVLRRCAASKEPTCEFKIGHAYDMTSSRHDDALNGFRELFLEPIYEYLDEHLDDQRAVLAMLRRYKHKCEWFARKELYELWERDTQTGERNLAKHLYEYLHDQGIDFHIEPQSISGEVDLIAAQKTDDPLVADAKIFDPGRSKGKSYIAKGFGQVYRYTVDFNEAFGYLVIYQTSEHELRFLLGSQCQSTPFVIHNNKTIFLLTIDIFPHEQSASKRGALKPHEISESDLIQIAEDAASGEAA